MSSENKMALVVDTGKTKQGQAHFKTVADNRNEGAKSFISEEEGPLDDMQSDRDLKSPTLPDALEGILVMDTIKAANRLVTDVKKSFAKKHENDTLDSKVSSDVGAALPRVETPFAE